VIDHQRRELENEYGIPYLYNNISIQAYVNLRKIYINLENHREYPRNLTLPESTVVADSMGLSLFKLSSWDSKDARVLKQNA